MTKIDLEKIIPNILESVNFHDYLLHENYTLIENASNEEHRSYFKEDISYKEILYVSLVNGKETFYSASYGDTGNLITFVKNRIELDGTYTSFNPKKNNVIEACKKLMLYLNNQNITNSGFEFKNLDINSFKAFQNATFTHFYEAKPVYSLKYLNSKGISKETALSALFQGKIFNTVGLYYKDASYDVINTAFPLYDLNNKEIGLVNMNTIALNDTQEEDILTEVVSSDLKRGFWISNQLNLHKANKTKLTLVDTPIEALAHYEIFQEDRVYFSFFNKSEKAFEIIYKLIENYNANLYLSSIVDVENIVFEFRLIVYILSQNHPISFVIENNNHINIRIGKGKDIKTFTERIQRLNQKLINHVLSSLGNSAKSYLDNEIVKASKDGDALIFKIPKTLQVLYEVSKIFTKTFETGTGIVTEKSTRFNWEKLALTNKNKTFADLVQQAEVFGFKNINY